MKTWNETKSFNTNNITLHCFIRAIPSCASLWVNIVLGCRTSEYLQISLGFWSTLKTITGYSSLLLTVIFLREKCVLFDLDQGSEMGKTSMAGQLELVLLLASCCWDPCVGSPSPLLAALFPWVAAAPVCLWCHSSRELVGLWGKASSLGISLLLPPAPNSVLISQHNFHCFLSCTNWNCFGNSLRHLLSSGKFSSVIKHWLEVWEAEFSVLLSHCFLYAFG